MPKRPLDPAEMEHVLAALAGLRTELGEVEQRLTGAYKVTTRQVKSTRRALAALDAAQRALKAAQTQESPPPPLAPRRRTGKGPGARIPGQ